MPPPTSPPSLPSELIEEIFLRLPPDEPASLVRASLASKSWLSLLTGRSFLSLYRDFHGAPPMLGFLYTWPPHYVPEEEDNVPQFVPTTKFGARIPEDGEEDWEDYSAWDCRHGRVLFSDMPKVPSLLTVWNPMTGYQTEMFAPVGYYSKRAAVACVASGCDHRACDDEGHFRVVFVGLTDANGRCVARAHLSSAEFGEWIMPRDSLDLEDEGAFLVDRPSVFIKDTFYFLIIIDDDDDDDDDYIAILKYDLASNCLSLIAAPPVVNGRADDVVLMAMEDGSLGFAHVVGLTLHLFSKEAGSNAVTAWIRRRVINLNELLPIRNPKRKFRLIGSVECNDIIFVTTDVGIYEINLRSLHWKKLWKRENYRALFSVHEFLQSQRKSEPL